MTDRDRDQTAVPEDSEEAFDGLSLEELGQAYAQAFAQSEGRASAESGVDEPHEDVGRHADAESAEEADISAGEPSSSPADDDLAPTPGAIIEAALFIGHPENRGFTEAELASLMRDVTDDDVSRCIDELNESYRTTGRALRIHRDEDGLRMGVAPEMETVRRAFYGKIRETRLSQAAIEVLSLVAYQPGITADKVQDQRGKESGSLLSQLVRRRLLEQRRVVPEGGTRAVAAYHPTERFLQLFGLESLDDLPQVEP